MLVADAYLGHRDDPSVAARLADADPARVRLSDTDRRRSRVRTETRDGRDLGVVVGRVLRDGDVLDANGTLVVVDLEPVDALVLEVADVPATVALELGHAIGNRHRDLAVRGDEALIPVADSRERTAALVAADLPDGVTTRFEAVPPTTFDDGGSDHGHDHSHRQDSSHAAAEAHDHADDGLHGHADEPNGHDPDHGDSRHGNVTEGGDGAGR